MCLSEDDAKRLYPDLSTVINRQTTYLDTAPKYPNPPRFRLRKRVVTSIIREKFDGEVFEKLPDRYLGQTDVERKCTELLHMYLGWSMADMLEHFGVAVNRSAKAFPKQYTALCV